MKKRITISLLLTISCSALVAQNWQWAKQASPSLRNNEIIGTSINNNGDVFACGYYITSLNIGTTTYLSVNFPGDYQNFIAKYNSAGVAQWLRNIEPQGPDATAGMEVSSDTLGNCYVASGYGYISSGPGGSFGYASSYGGFHYLRKINSSGSDVWVQTPTFGSNSGCSFESMKTDGAGNTYITGPFQGTVTFGSITLTSVTNEDVFIVKYDPSGFVEYAKQATAYGPAKGHSIDVDYAGNVVVVGEFQSDITFGTTTLTSNGGRDYFMVRLDNTGNVVWAKSYGSNYDDELWGVAIDYPRIYVTGNFGANFTFGSLSLTTHGLQDIMVACTDMSGNELWALSNGGGSDRDLGYDITTDHNGGVYASGNYNGPATFGTTNLTGADGAYVAKYDINGNQQWVKKVVGTSMSASGKSISANSNAEIVMAGTFCCFGSTLDFSSSSFSLNANGGPGNYGSGFYLAKLGNCNMAVSAGSNVSISCSDTTLLTATGGTSYSWAPSTGLVTNNTASVQAHPVATTTYTCTIGEASGCTSTAMVTVTVTGGPTISLTGTTSVCQGASTQLTAGGGATNYAWLPTTGVSNPTIANPTITPTNLTTYTVTATDTYGCASSAAVTITVNPTYSSNINASICQGATYTFPDNTTATSATVHTSHLSSAYTCDSSIVTTLTINPVYSSNVNATICQGDTYTFPDNTTTTSATVHTSHFSTIFSCDSSIVTTITVNPIFSSNVSASICQGDTYTFPDNTTATSATVYTSHFSTMYSCDSRITTTLAINSLPTINVASGASVFCADAGNTALLGLPSGGSWSGIGVSGNTFSPTVSGAGNFTAVYTFTNGNGCTNKDSIAMTVNSLPLLSVTAADTLLCVNHSDETLLALPSGGNWSGNGIIGSSFSPTTAGAGTHIITYSFTDGNGCSNSVSLTMTVDLCTDVNEINNNNSISIYPNPTDGQFTISLSKGNAKIIITDLLGKEIKTINLTGKQLVIEKDEMKAGIYFIQTTDENKNVTKKKIIIQ